MKGFIVNKIFFMFIFFQSSFSYASDASWILKSYNHKNEETKKQIVMEKDLLIVQGRKLSPVEVQLKFNWLDSLFKKPKAQVKNCHSGRYTLTSEIKKRHVIEKGCLEDQRYREIVKSFENLEKEEILQ